MAKTAKRTRRTPEQMIAELEAKIEDVRNRAKRREVKKSSAVRQLLATVKAIDKGIAAAIEEGSATLKKTLAEGREPLAAYLALEGVKVLVARGAGSGESRRGRRKPG
jgi:hypothetical protein